MTAQTKIDAKERTTLLGLLDWAFRRQLAHQGGEEGFGLRLGSPRDSCAKLEAMRGVMGCKIDGGEWKEIGHRVHLDAADVVATVGLLPDVSAALVYQYAAAGSQPDWGEVCKVWPVVRDNGKVAVNSHDVVIVDRRGRKTIVAASFCPFEIFPNIDYCREEWRMWYRGLEVLMAMLPEMRRWEVIGVGVEAEPWRAG